MNERIIELANEANKDIGYTFKMEEAKQLHELMEKFAELIIRECMEVCKSRVGNSDYNTGRMHCASDLKEHFGVEE